MGDRYYQYFDELPSYATVLDQEHRILHANRWFREEFGDRIGEYCYKVYMNREDKCQGCLMERSLQDGNCHESEIIIISRSGESIHVLVTTAPIRNEAGEINEILEMTTRAAPWREVKARLASLNSLVGSISHGIRGQLTGLDGGFYMMKSGYEKNNPDRIKKGMSMVQRNVERISSMVQDILYYAKDREPLWEDVPLKDVIREFAETMEKKANNLGIDFSAEIAKGIGSLEADPRMIRAMLANIIYYSIESCSTDQQGKEHRINLSVSEDDRNMIFRIDDNGTCMDSETREKVLNPFFSPQGVGETGLGLFISNKLATIHCGSIKAGSGPHAGNTVVITIPKRRAR